MEDKFTIIRVMQVIVMGMLLWALADNPYGYYQILRWIVCGFFGYFAFLTHDHNDIKWTWIFSGIAILFNPIIPIYLEREVWQVIDVIVAIVILASIFKIKLESESVVK